MSKGHLIKRLAFISIFVSIFYSGCKQIKNEPSEPVISIMPAEDFDLFYNRFHKDSLFQISRVKFPLRGGPDKGNPDEEWTRENWAMLKTRIYDVDTTLFNVSYTRLKNSFTEKVWLENSGFEFECRFELIENKWFLVSASELNN